MSKKKDVSNEGNVVWIELKQWVDEADANKQCELANNMMRRLNREKPEDAPQFRFYSNGPYYVLSFGQNAGSLILLERGHWFNLDHLGR